MTEKEIQYREKQEMKRPGEPTKSGLTFVPPVDIYETAEALTLLADMPGVTPEGLVIDLKDNQITITGQTQDPTGPQEHFLLKEYETGHFYRQFALPEVIDQGKIRAQLKNGELTLVLPKQEKAKPRRIEIKVD
ncbi:MAG: Hsp20/alpha crystallin family protein [Deltaproteobacteria bacterium]|nr:Hsp20/alpha crystallin family protein [Deltaproteobacteria bacterium]